MEVTLERQTPYFDYLLALPSFFPQNRKAVEEYGNKYATSSDTSVYNGPFVLTDFDGPGNDTEWSYTKNENYWDKETVQLDKIEVTVIKEAPTALNLFQDGQVDDIILSGELANQMADDPQLVIVKEARTSYLDFNKKQEDSLFKNENLRKAISYSIDRQAAVTNILRNGSIASTGLVPSGMSFSTDGNKDFSNENKKRVAYNEEKAKEHFEAAKKELGMDTLTFDILGEDTDSVKKVLEYIQASINDTLEGVKATVTTVPFSVRLDREKSGKFDVVMSGWGADYADPSSFLDLFVTGNSYNRGGYLNQEYDTLVAAASETDASDSKKRWKDMVEAESVLLEEMGVAPIYQRAEAHMVNEKIKGIVAHSAGATFDYKWAYVTK